MGVCEAEIDPAVERAADVVFDHTEIVELAVDDLFTPGSFWLNPRYWGLGLGLGLGLKLDRVISA